jgi:hypothetical protein
VDSSIEIKISDLHKNPSMVLEEFGFAFSENGKVWNSQRKWEADFIAWEF